VEKVFGVGEVGKRRVTKERVPRARLPESLQEGFDVEERMRT